MYHQIISSTSIFLLFFCPRISSQTYSKEYLFTDFSMDQFQAILSDFKKHEITLSSIKDLYGIALYNRLAVVNDKIDVYINIRNQHITQMDFVISGYIYQLKTRDPAYDKLIEIDYAYVDELIYLNYKRSISDKLVEGLSFENGQIHKEVLIEDMVIVTDYHSNGNRAVVGAYNAAQMYVSDTVRIVDPVKYTTDYEISPRLNADAKTGTWMYFDAQGKLLHQERY